VGKLGRKQDVAIACTCCLKETLELGKEEGTTAWKCCLRTTFELGKVRLFGGNF
jgi:hypothetical protein